MMRRVWAAVISVWATLAIAAGLAWTWHPATPASSATIPATAGATRTTSAKGAVTVPVSAGAPHATTRTS
jgi:hypothetical protein